MDSTPRKVTEKELAPGMTLCAVTAFSAEYSYLDSRLIAQLRERLGGATCRVRRKGKVLQLTVEELAPLDALEAIATVPARPGLAPLDGETVEAFRRAGLRAFEVTGQGTAPAPSDEVGTGSAAAVAAQGVPSTVQGDRAAKAERAARAKALLEQVAMAAEQREQSSVLVQELFSQGRAGRYSTSPAEHAVEEIVSQGLSGAMSAVAGLRGSDQTYAHCVDMSVIFQEAWADILEHQGGKVGKDLVRQTLLAGFCHDIGKSRVPKDILESRERFAPDSKEMLAMRSHAAEGAKILTGLGMDRNTVNVAHYHHVKADTKLPSSYPQANWSDVLPITRLAAVVDVYQALIGKRSYKRNWVPGKATQYLRELRGKEFDPPMLDYFLRVIGLYPVGSLLRLNTGELAFVITIGTEVLERPVVAIVENAQGELLSQNPVVDLMDEPDLSVTEVVDHYQHYGDDEDKAFKLFVGLRPI